MTGLEQLFRWVIDAGQPRQRPLQPVTAAVTSEIHIVRVFSLAQAGKDVGTMALGHMICIPMGVSLVQAFYKGESYFQNALGFLA